MPKNIQVGLLVTGDAKGAVKAVSLTEKEIGKLNAAKKRATASARGLSNQWNTLRNIAGGYIALRTSQFLIQEADAWKNINARLKVATAHFGDYASVQKDFIQISRDTYTNLESVGTVYTRLARATKELGTTQEEVGTVTRALGQAMVVSGSTAHEANNALIQLSQGLAAGALRGDEFRAVMEQAPRVVEALKDELNLTTGQLRDMAHAGELTTEIIVDAIKSQAEAIQREMDQMPITVQRAVIALEREFQVYLGNLDESLGATQALSDSISWLADNLDTLATALGVVAALLAGPIIASLMRAAPALLAFGAGINVIKLLGGPGGIAITAATAVYLLAGRWGDLAEAAKIATEAQHDFNRAVATGSDKFEEAGIKAIESAQNYVTALEAQIGSVEALNEANIAGVTGITVLNEDLETAKAALVNIKAALEHAKDPLSAFGGAGEEVAGQVDDLSGSLDLLGQKVKSITDSLELEIQMIGKSAVEKEILQKISSAGADITEKEAKRIADLVKQKHAMIKAIEDEKAAREAWQAQAEKDLEARIEEEEAIREAQAELDRYIDDLKFELSIMKLSDDERAVQIALRNANTTAATAEGAQIAALTREIQAEARAMEEAKEAAEQWTKIMDTAIESIQRAAGDSIYDALWAEGEAKAIIEEEFGAAMDELQAQLDRGEISAQEFEEQRLKLHQDYNEKIKEADRDLGDHWADFWGSMVDIVKKAIAEMVAAFVTSGIAGLLSGKGLSGFSIPGISIGGGGGSFLGGLVGGGGGKVVTSGPFAGTTGLFGGVATSTGAGGSTALIATSGATGLTPGVAIGSAGVIPPVGYTAPAAATPAAAAGGGLATASAYVPWAMAAVAAYDIFTAKSVPLDQQIQAAIDKGGTLLNPEHFRTEMERMFREISPLGGSIRRGFIGESEKEQQFAQYAAQQGFTVDTVEGVGSRISREGGGRGEGFEGPDVLELAQQFEEMLEILPEVQAAAEEAFAAIGVGAEELATSMQDGFIDTTELAAMGFADLGELSVEQMGQIADAVNAGTLSLDALQGNAALTGAEFKILRDIGVSSLQEVDLITQAAGHTLRDLGATGRQTGKELSNSFGAFAGQLNQATDAARGLGRAINAIPNAPGAPATPFAEGGIVTSPTYALLGEAGPEAVIPLKNGSVPVEGSGNNDEIHALRREQADQAYRIEELTAELVTTNTRIAKAIESGNRRVESMTRR